MRCMWVLAALLPLVAVLPASGWTKGIPAEMVIVSSDFPPFSFLNSEGRAEGIYVSFMEELLKPLGATPKFEIVPFKRAMAMLESGQADAMLGLVRTLERQAFLHFLEPPYPITACQAFFVPKVGAVEIYSDLYTLKGIGVVSGYKQFSPFDNDPRLVKDECLTGLMGMRKLVHGRIDALLLPEDIGDYLLVTQHMQDKVKKARFRVCESTPIYLCLSKKSPWSTRSKELSARFMQMVRHKRGEAITKQYLKQPPHPDAP